MKSFWKKKEIPERHKTPQKLLGRNGRKGTTSHLLSVFLKRIHISKWYVEIMKKTRSLAPSEVFIPVPEAKDE
jgi:hypothetical protein